MEWSLHARNLAPTNTKPNAKVAQRKDSQEPHTVKQTPAHGALLGSR